MRVIRNHWVYNKVINEPTQKKMKQLKYTIYEIEKERVMKKAAQEVEKQFFDKSSEDI